MSDASISTSAVPSEELTPQGKKAITGAFFGLAVDFYDIYLPTVALTPAIIYFFAKNLPLQTAATLNFTVFSVTLTGRPLGAFIFGHFGDVTGRRRTTLTAAGASRASALL